MASILPSNWPLPEIFRQRLGETVGRQRAMFHEAHLLLVLHEVPEPGVPERVGVFFWRSPEGKWKTNLSGAGLPGLRELIRRYAARVDALEAAYGDATSAKALFPILRASTPIVRAAKHVREVLQSARESVRSDRDIINLRDLAGEVERAAELLNEEAKTALEFDIAEAAQEATRINSELAEAGQRLNLLAAMFLPLTAVASVFGMNLPSGLEKVLTPTLFWLVLLAGIFVGYVIRNRLGGTNAQS
ncbi:MAG: CorA family divalent cation transporter [Myxococcota bacterium]